eukprot:1061827-Prymnesium_polylepis.1
MSEDHKPALESESRRIEEAGGWVTAQGRMCVPHARPHGRTGPRAALLKAALLKAATPARRAPAVTAISISLARWAISSTRATAACPRLRRSSQRSRKCARTTSRPTTSSSCSRATASGIAWCAGPPRPEGARGRASVHGRASRHRQLNPAPSRARQSNQEVCDFVRERIATTALDKIAEEIFDHCISEDPK